MQLPDTGIGDETTTCQNFDIEEEVFETMSRVLIKQFHKAFFVPCYNGRLFDDISFTGDTEGARRILDGASVF